MCPYSFLIFAFFFFNDTATTEIYTTANTLSYTTLFRSDRRQNRIGHILGPRVLRRQLQPGSVFTILGHAPGAAPAEPHARKRLAHLRVDDRQIRRRGPTGRRGRLDHPIQRLAQLERASKRGTRGGGAPGRLAPETRRAGAGKDAAGFGPRDQVAERPQMLLRRAAAAADGVREIDRELAAAEVEGVIGLRAQGRFRCNHQNSLDRLP